eukprot:CAMPEP_0202476442 /NCGR_PEP_ID=MMETSP1360-20130828/93428_1 /ASSEMBLY_ACC=CAM_ASM_000848 /TAXON_ID=515479 /ORGANISM="Licmophora paradoxa, Strain CCMP2313" /LENGTH=89 /DNA_ID=CAMNT_0049103651 /DNA_START=79 /DNA_END=348 /DNA_ORIENTATION=-
MTTSRVTLVFPLPTLTKVSIEPSIADIKLLKKELYVNAAAIYSTRGGGANGHLAIIMNEAAYLARANIAFEIPVHPGTTPTHPASASGP